LSYKHRMQEFDQGDGTQPQQEKVDDNEQKIQLQAKEVSTPLLASKAVEITGSYDNPAGEELATRMGVLLDEVREHLLSDEQLLATLLAEFSEHLLGSTDSEKLENMREIFRRAVVSSHSIIEKFGHIDGAHATKAEFGDGQIHLVPDPSLLEANGYRRMVTEDELRDAQGSEDNDFVRVGFASLKKQDKNRARRLLIPFGFLTQPVDLVKPLVRGKQNTYPVTVYRAICLSVGLENKGRNDGKLSFTVHVTGSTFVDLSDDARKSLSRKRNRQDEAHRRAYLNMIYAYVDGSNGAASSQRSRPRN
jgi:hypothetical protein